MRPCVASHYWNTRTSPRNATSQKARRGGERGRAKAGRGYDGVRGREEEVPGQRIRAGICARYRAGAAPRITGLRAVAHRRCLAARAGHRAANGTLEGHQAARARGLSQAERADSAQKRDLARRGTLSHRHASGRDATHSRGPRAGLARRPSTAAASRACFDSTKIAIAVDDEPDMLLAIDAGVAAPWPSSRLAWPGWSELRFYGGLSEGEMRGGVWAALCAP